MNKLVSILLLCVSMQAGALELKGVQVPDSARVGDATLQLNGAGIRTKFFFKVYVGGLYLDKKTHDAATVLANTGARRVAMYWLLGVGSKRIRDGFREGFDANNTPAEITALAPQLRQFLAIFDKFREVNEGDVFDLDYIPGEGLRASMNGKEMGRVAGADFYRALLRVWFGRHAVDSDLEQGMLGSPD